MTTAPIDDEIVILNLKSNNYVGLDPIGRRIWEILDTVRSVEELCRLLSLEYEADPEQIASDVLPFLNEMEKEGLVQVLHEQSG
jgi:hypothetical protein